MFTSHDISITLTQNYHISTQLFLNTLTMEPHKQIGYKYLFFLLMFNSGELQDLFQLHQPIIGAFERELQWSASFASNTH